MASSPACTCTVCPVHAHQPRSAVDTGLDAWPQWTNPTLDHLASVVAWLGGPEAMAAGHGVLEAHLHAGVLGDADAVLDPGAASVA